MLSGLRALYSYFHCFQGDDMTPGICFISLSGCLCAPWQNYEGQQVYPPGLPGSQAYRGYRPGVSQHQNSIEILRPPPVVPAAHCSVSATLHS